MDEGMNVKAKPDVGFLAVMDSLLDQLTTVTTNLESRHIYLNYLVDSKDVPQSSPSKIEPLSFPGGGGEIGDRLKRLDMIIERLLYTNRMIEHVSERFYEGSAPMLNTYNESGPCADAHGKAKSYYRNDEQELNR